MIITDFSSSLPQGHPANTFDSTTPHKVRSGPAAHAHLNTPAPRWLSSECWHLEQIPCWLNHGKYCVSFVHHTWTWLMVVVVIHHCCEREPLGWRAWCSNLSSLFPFDSPRCSSVASLSLSPSLLSRGAEGHQSRCRGTPSVTQQIKI